MGRVEWVEGCAAAADRVMGEFGEILTGARQKRKRTIMREEGKR